MTFGSLLAPFRPAMTRAQAAPVLRVGAWALLVAAALWPRLLGYNQVPLWLDEAWRANLILGEGWLAGLFGGSTSGSLTSVGYAVFVRILNSVNGTEGALRLSSLLPGAAAVLLFVPVVTLATGSRALGWISAFVAAINPMFIAYAKELKPYCFELCGHLFLLFLALKYIEDLRRGLTPTGWFMILCLLAGPAAAIASPNFVFLLPGWFLSLLLASWRFSRRNVRLHAVSAAVVLVLIGGQYLYLWSQATRDAGLIHYWREGFFAGNMPRLYWTAAQFNSMVQRSIDTTRYVFPAGNAAFSGAVAILALAGLAGSLSVRNPSRFLLVISPLVAVIAANAMTLWPLGPIRVNLFLFGYLIVLVFMGGSNLAGWVGRAASPRMEGLFHSGVAAMFLLYCLIAFPRILPLAREFGPPNEDMPRALQALLEQIRVPAAQRTLVVANRTASPALTYYTTHHASLSEPLGGTLRGRVELLLADEAYSSPDSFSKAVASRIAEHESIWFLYSHLSPPEASIQKNSAARFGEIRNEYAASGAGIFELVRSRQGGAEPPDRRTP